MSPFYEDCDFYINDIIFLNNCFVIPNKSSYIGSMLADYLRDCYVGSEEKLFSFETVFSHKSKVDFLKIAKDKGWEVYLYFIGTSNPLVNCARVRERALKGEHDVPQDKIIERYTRSLDNLFSALQYCRRAYVFDNSLANMQLIAIKNPDNSIIISNEDSIPQWVDEYMLSKIDKKESVD
jgi:predicted ABC-type ATPase